MPLHVQAIQCDDAAVVALQRRRMFEEFGFDPDAVAASCAGLSDWLPHPFHPTAPLRGYLCNVYVEEHARRRGIARELVLRCEQECARRDVEVVQLHASSGSGDLCASLGYEPTREFRKRLVGPEGSEGR